jgi:hypothetical protein
MDSLAISKEVGRAALQLSRSHSQLAVTLSKSELKRLITTCARLRNLLREDQLIRQVLQH